jgi:hypothetical protein
MLQWHFSDSSTLKKKVMLIDLWADVSIQILMLGEPRTSSLGFTSNKNSSSTAKVKEFVRNRGAGLWEAESPNMGVNEKLHQSRL